MTGQMGDTARRLLAASFAFALLFTALPGTSWTANTDPDLEGSVVARLDFVNDGSTRQDPSGHGTFVAGLIAAHGETFKGVAPDAKLISLRVLDQKGTGTMHGVLGAFDWLLHNRTTMHIKVLNLPFGAPQRSSYHRSLLAGVVESAWFAGIAVGASP